MGIRDDVTIRSNTKDEIVIKLGTPQNAKIGLTIPQMANGGVIDYSKKTVNKPQINSVELDGNVSFDDLGITALLDEKVDKEDGKSLSSNDYTDEEKDKLAGIEAGSQENVIEEVLVNGSPVEISDKSVDIHIPTDISELNNDSGYLTNHQDISGKADKSELSTVANTGNYNDLNNKPIIPTKTSDLQNDSGFLTEHQDISNKANKSELSNIALTGEYGDLLNKPIIPSRTSELTNDSGYLTEHQSLDDYATKEYVDEATEGITSNLVDLTDTEIINPTDGQVLTYDNESGKWVNDDAKAIHEDADDIEILNMLTELGYTSPLCDSSGSVIVDSTNSIITV